MDFIYNKNYTLFRFWKDIYDEKLTIFSWSDIINIIDINKILYLKNNIINNPNTIDINNCIDISVILLLLSSILLASIMILRIQIIILLLPILYLFMKNEKINATRNIIIQPNVKTNQKGKINLINTQINHNKTPITKNIKNHDIVVGYNNLVLNKMLKLLIILLLN